MKAKYKLDREEDMMRCEYDEGDHRAAIGVQRIQRETDEALLKRAKKIVKIYQKEAENEVP